MEFITPLLLPKRDNLGKPVPKDVYRAFHARMIRRFRGWTRKGDAEGAWLSPSGNLFVDDHWVYEIGHTRKDLAFWRAEKNGSRRSSTRKRSGSCNTKAGVFDVQ